MNRAFGILLAIVLVASLGEVTTVPVEAGSMTWYVVEGGAGDETGVSLARAFANIQDAIEVAGDGDSIEVAAGQYESFLVEAKQNIRIIGAEGTIVAGADRVSINRGPITEAWSMAAVKDSQDISIRGISFDGGIVGQPGESREVVVGVAYVNSTGRIADLNVDNVAGAELGVGVAIIGDGGNSVVDLDRVSVRNSMAGVIVWDAEASLDGCIITGMKPNGGFGIMDSGVGIVVGIPGEDWRGPSTARVKGSTISDNNDIGIYVCDDSILEAHFNNIVGNALFGVLNDGGQRVDAAYNWWGDASGPAPYGTGNAVSDGVDVIPWVASRTVTETVTDGTVDAKDEADTEVEVKGTATVTVTRYLSDPGADVTVPFITQSEYVDIYPMGKWIDVYVPDVSQLEELEIRLYYTVDELGDLGAYQRYLRLFWWDGSEWIECSNSEVNTAAGYILATIGTGTTPSLADLEGTPFGGYGSPPPIPQPCGCFIATAAYGTDTAAEIAILTEFRDAVLLSNSFGAGLVSLYYRTSRPAAAVISRCEVLRAVVRVGLIAPIAALLHDSRHLWLAGGP